MTIQSLALTIETYVRQSMPRYIEELQTLYAIEALLTMDCRSFREIRLVCVSDEEIVDRHSKQILHQNCSGGHGALVLEAARPNGDIISARKGTMWYTLTANGRSAHA